MRFFKAGKSKSAAIPVVFGVIVVIALVLSMGNMQPDYKDYTQGVWTDGVYTSEFLNLQFTLPEGWTAASQEELDALMQQAMEQSKEDDPETAKGYEDGLVKNAYEFKATEDGGDGLVVVIAQKMRISPDNYLEKLAAQYEGTNAVVNELPGWTLGNYGYKGLKIELGDKLQYIYAMFDEGYFTTIQMGSTSELDLIELRDNQFADYAVEEK